MRALLATALALLMVAGASAGPEPWRAFPWLPADPALKGLVAEFFRLDPERLPRLEILPEGGLAVVNPGGAPSATAWSPLRDLDPGVWTLRFRARWQGEGEPPLASAVFLSSSDTFQASRAWTEQGVTTPVPGPMGPGSAIVGMRGREGRLEVTAMERVRLPFGALADDAGGRLRLRLIGEPLSGLQLEMASRPLEGWSGPPVRTSRVPLQGDGADWVPSAGLEALFTPPVLAEPFLVRWRILDSAGRVLHSGGTVRMGDPEELPRGPVRRRVEVGPGGVLQVEGKPFFPLGLYTHETSRQALDAVEDLGLNLALMAPAEGVGDLVREARKRGLEVILENQVPPDRQELEPAVREVVARYGDLPVLAWSMVDEPDLKPPYHPVLADLHRAVAAADSRPLFQSNHSPGSLASTTVTADILALDPYPLSAIPRPLATVGAWLDEAQRTAPPARSLWFVNQSFAMAPIWPEPPTPDQHRAMTWIALIHGARGLVYYTLHDILYPGAPDHRWELRRSPLWDGIRREAAEIRALEPYLLLPEGPKRSVRPGPLDSALWEGPDQALLAVVNPTNRPAVGAVTLEGNRRRARVWPEGTPVDLVRGSLAVQVPPYGVLLFEVEP